MVCLCRRLLLFFTDLKEYLKCGMGDIIEQLDDYYLLFVNKYEDVMVLLIKSLILGLGSSFEIERKISQPTISFEYDSRVFRNFLNLICKLFGCTLEIRIEGKAPETFSFDPSQAKVRIGKGSPITIEVTSSQNLSLIYEPHFFISRGVPLEVINLGTMKAETISQGEGVGILKKHAMGENSGEKRTSSDQKKENGEQHFMMEEEYISNHNIINPYSMYNSEIDFKRTSIIDDENQIPNDGLPNGMIEQPKQIINLADFYSGDKDAGTYRQDTNSKDISDFSPAPLPGLKVREPISKEVQIQKPTTQHAWQAENSFNLPQIELKPIQVAYPGPDMKATEVDSSSEEEPEGKGKVGSEEPSILYKYNLEQSIDFMNGTNYLESVVSFVKDDQVISQKKGGGYYPNLIPNPGSFIPPSNFNQSNQPIPSPQSSEKKGSLSDHIKLLMSNDYESKATTEMMSHNPHPHGSQDMLNHGHYHPLINPPINSHDNFGRPTVSNEQVQPIITSFKDIEPRAAPNANSPRPPSPHPIGYQNPLMMKFGEYSNSQTSYVPLQVGPTNSEGLKPLVNCSEESLAKKRPTANVELMHQINQALITKLLNDSGKKTSSPLKLDRPLDFTPLEEKTQPQDSSGTRKQSSSAIVESDVVTRKTRFLTQSDTDKPCRLCSKVFKMTKMYYYDGSFFCDACYSTASQKLKKKGINSCPGCAKESAKILIIKFILSNTFTRNQGSLLFTKEKKVEPYYGYLQKYALVVPKAKSLEQGLTLISNNIVTPVTTYAEIKTCKTCSESFDKCCMCKDLLYKSELFKSDACSHAYCLDCLSLLFLKKYVQKLEFTCKASFCWKKTSLDHALRFIVQSLEALQTELSQSGLRVQ